MKLVIGIVGPPLAGKETAANIFAELLERDGRSVSRHRFSDILRDTLDLWGIPHGRDNEQLMAIVMNAETGFRDGALSRAMKHRLSTDTTNVGILDGVRWLSDEKMLRSFPAEDIKSLIVRVSADLEVRYKRLIARNRSGEAATTREDFLRQEKVRTEVEIPQIGSRADITLMNDYDNVDEFRKQVEKAYQEKIKPLL